MFIKLTTHTERMIMNQELNVNGGVQHSRRKSYYISQCGKKKKKTATLKEVCGYKRNSMKLNMCSRFP